MTHAQVYSGFQARSIQRLDFLTTFTDTSPDGPPGDYTVTYRCQYSYNTIDTNPVGNIIQIPVSALAPSMKSCLTSWNVSHYVSWFKHACRPTAGNTGA